MTDANLFAVLLAKPSHLDPAKIAPVIAQFRSIPYADATRITRGSWGIVADDLTESRARDLAASLEAAGLGGWIISKGAIAELPPIVAVRKASVLAENFLTEAAGAPPCACGTNIRLLAAAGFQESMRLVVQQKEGPSSQQKMLNMGIMLATGLPIKFGGKERMVEKVQERSELVFFLDIVLKSPLLRLRIAAADFNYAYLGARKEYNTLGNFKLLIADLARIAPQALVSRGTRILLEGKEIASMGYDSIADLERETRWLLTLA